ATFELPRLLNEVNTPQTVPNRPMNGATDAVVARNVKRLSSNVSCAAEARCMALWTIVTLPVAVRTARPPPPWERVDGLCMNSTPELNTGTSGVKRKVSSAVAISERFWPFRKIFQNTSDSFRTLRSSNVLERITPHEATEKINNTARTILAVKLVVRNTER